MADGMPTLPDQTVTVTAQLLTSDQIQQSQSGVRYGLYLNGVLVLEPDSFISYSYSNESRLPQYPQEKGAFQTYNKVDTPFDVKVRIAKGGSLADVSYFIDTAESLAKASDLNLYTMISPEQQYSSVNVQKIMHEHKPSNGASMVTMDIYLLEIRNAATAQYANTASPTTTGSLNNTTSATSADKKNTGTVQPTTPTAAQTTVATSGLAALSDAINGGEVVVP